MAGKKLAANVYVDGQWYGPAYGNESDVPAEAAKKIGSEDAWEQPASKSDDK